MTRTPWIAAAAAVGLLGGLIALAEGIPSTDPLFYSGVLEESGIPVTGPRDIRVVLWSSATDSGASARLCVTAPTSKTDVAQGHFRLALDPTCVAAIRQNPEVWVELAVEGEALPRTKLGAVPFAIEADHARTASAAVGELKGQLDGLAKPAVTYGGRRFSLDGAYCGSTSPRTGNLGGFAGAKSLCETACGSPGAHMCFTQELVRMVALGWAPPATGWGGGIGEEYDCSYWTCSSNTSCGNYATKGEVLTAAGAFEYGACGASYPVLCCD